MVLSTATSVHPPTPSPYRVLLRRDRDVFGCWWDVAVMGPLGEECHSVAWSYLGARFQARKLTRHATLRATS